MRRVAIALLLSSAFAAAVVAQTPVTQTGTVGTFDKTSIVIAYYNSPQWQATLQEKQQEKDTATKANDTAKANTLEEWGQASQELAMQQLTGKAPIDNILEALQPAFKDIESSLHLSSIVVSPSPDASAATVDVTAQLLDWLHADARTRGWISDMKQQGVAAHAVAGDPATADMAVVAEDTRNAAVASRYMTQLVGAGDVGVTRLAASRAAMTADTAAAAAETAAAAVESDASQATAASAAGDRTSANNARDKAVSDYSALLAADDKLAKAATDLVAAATGNAAFYAANPGNAAINDMGAQDSSAAANLLSAATKGGTAGYNAAASNEATAIQDANTIAGRAHAKAPDYNAAAKAEAEAQSAATAAAAGGNASAAAVAVVAAANTGATADESGNPYAMVVECGAAAVANAASATISAQHAMDRLKTLK